MRPVRNVHSSKDDGAAAVANMVQRVWAEWSARLVASRLARVLRSPRAERLITLNITAALVAIVIVKLHALGLAVFAPLGRVGAVFWLVFVADYLLTPAAERVIYRWRWGRRGEILPTLLQKQAANALLIPYSGETLLFAWARRNGVATKAAFAAVKDVALLSALAGSMGTIGLAAVGAGPLSKALGLSPAAMLASVGLLCSAPVLGLLINRSLSTDGMHKAPRIAAVQLARVMLNVGLVALMWRLLWPQVPASTWLMLSSGRLVVTRLPLIPQRDVALAAFTLVLLPGQQALTSAATITGALLMLAHVLVWVLTQRWLPGAVTDGAVAAPAIG
ncbi:MAG: hypothetical protein JO157_11090 [Acetobacteraceae bacterium]|nr:hypothetical protein [Acetobacteraceae bacterium]